MPAKTATQRDVSRALAMVMRMQQRLQAGETTTMGDLDDLDMLASILEDIDARTGRRDPTVRRRVAKAKARR